MNTNIPGTVSLGIHGNTPVVPPNYSPEATLVSGVNNVMPPTLAMIIPSVFMISVM
jgi:hypothetical protein